MRHLIKWTSIAAGALGIGTLAFDLLGPTYMWRSLGPAGGSSGTSSLFELGVAPQAGAFIFVAAVTCILLGVSGWRLSQTNSTVFFAGLVLFEALVVGEVLFGGWFLGPSLIPEAILGGLAVGAAIVSDWMTARTRKTASRSTE